MIQLSSICDVYDHFREDDNHMQVLLMLKSKLPRSVVVDLDKIKTENEEWTVKKFRKLLLRHINVQKGRNLQIKLFKKNDEVRRVKLTNISFQSDANTKNVAGETLLSNKNIKNVKTKYGRKCVFFTGVMMMTTRVMNANGILISNQGE